MLPYDILANTWIFLQARIDIASIVREVLAHFVLESKKSSSAEVPFDFFIWIKAVFDLQRTYSQSIPASPSTNSLSYLLPHALLVDTISFTVQARPRYQHGRDSQIEDDAYRYFAARTLLSGLRALQLRQRDPVTHNLNQLREITTSIERWWNEADGVPAERFILGKCKDAISGIQQGPGPNSVWHIPASGACQLRDYEDDLYDPAIDGVAAGAFTNHLELLRADHEHSFWALYDILWAAEVGHIQWSADKLAGKNVMEYSNELDTLVATVDTKIPDRISVTVLLHNWTQDLTSSSSLALPLSNCLADFRAFLECRHGTLVDYNLQIRQLSKDLQSSIETWVRTVCGLRSNESLGAAGHLSLGTAYVMGCPQLHVVPENDLKSRIRPDRHGIFDNPRLLDLQEFPIDCPRCSPMEGRSTTTVRYARMIEPLQYISGRLDDLTKKLEPPPNASKHISLGSSDSAIHTRPSPLAADIQQGQPSVQVPRIEQTTTTEQLSASTTAITSPPNSPSELSGESDITSVSSNEKARGFGRALTFLKPRKPTPKAKTEVRSGQVFEHHCFSNDGKSLLLWDEKRICSSVIRTSNEQDSVPLWSWKVFPKANTLLVAGGADKIAAVVKDSERLKFQSFSALHTFGVEPIVDKLIPYFGTIRSIAISHYGNRAAVGSDQAILIFDTTDNTIVPKRVMLSSETVDSQQMNFSRDGTKLAIGTRKLNGQIQIMLYDCVQSEESWPRIFTKNEEIVNGDYGLSALLYDNQTEQILLTGYTNKSYDLRYSRLSGSLHWDDRNGKIQAATYCMIGSKYRLLTGSGHLWEVDLSQDAAPKCLIPKIHARKSPTSPDGFVSLAMPEAECMYIFRKDGNNGMVFEVMTGNYPPVAKPFRGPPLTDSAG